MPLQAETRPPIEAVLFDYGLVLTGPPDPDAWEQMRALLGVEESAFHHAYWLYRHDYDRGALDGVRYWGAVARHLQRALPDPQVGVLLQADVQLWTQPNEPMIAWAAALQAAGVRTGILSNLGDAMEDGILQRLSWLQGFRHHTFSHRLGTVKPDPAIYRHAADALGVRAEDVLFVDDKEENVQGARKAGMQALQYTNHEQFRRDFLLGGYNERLPLVPEQAFAGALVIRRSGS